MHVRAHLQLYNQTPAQSSLPTALRSDSLGLQRRGILCPNLRQSTRLLHQQRRRDHRDAGPCCVSNTTIRCPAVLSMYAPISWNRLPDPNASPPTTEAGITNLFKEIRSTVDQEVRIVKAVFPNPAVVMQVFLQRVFAQSVSHADVSPIRTASQSSSKQIQQYMEQLLNKGSSVSDLAYLRMLQLVHSRCTSLVEDLKVHELPVTSIRSAIIDEPSDLRSSLSTSAVALSGAPATSMSIMLETAMEELFVPYTEGQRYLERESRSLGALYSSFLSNFARYHVMSFACLARTILIPASTGKICQGKIICLRSNGNASGGSSGRNDHYRSLLDVCAGCRSTDAVRRLRRRRESPGKAH